MLFTCLHICSIICSVYLGINLSELLYNRARNYLQGYMGIVAWYRYQIPHMGKARNFKNHVTPAVLSFVVISTYVIFFIIEFGHRPFRKCIVILSLDKKNCAFYHWNAIKMTFLACRQLKFLSYTGHCLWVGAVFRCILCHSSEKLSAKRNIFFYLNFFFFF